MDIYKTKNFYLIVLCFSIFYITSCTDHLYFDTAPKSNSELVKKELKKWPNLAGVYKLNISYIDSTHDQFIQNKYNNYKAPLLSNSSDDTLKYLASTVFGSKYLQITVDKGVCHFLNFECVNKDIFDHYFSSGTRTVKDGEKKLSEISAILKNDSIKIKLHNYEKKKGSSQDTTIQYRAWSRGELICFSTGEETYFPKSIDINNMNDSAFNYFSFIQNQIYYIQKDTTNSKTKFEISNLQLSTNSFIIKTLNRFDTADTVLNKLGVIHKDDILHYNESQLTSIFNSPLAINEISANRIEGFPLLLEESHSTLSNYVYYIVIGAFIFIIAIWFPFSRLKKKI